MADLLRSGYYSDPEATAPNPDGPASGTYHVLRGGGWSHYADDCRAAYRSGSAPDYRSLYSGFRCAAGTWGGYPDPPDDTTDGDQSDVSGTSNDPVNTATGNFFYQETDLTIPSRGSPLIFTRYYNSKAAAPAAKAGKSGQAFAKSKQAPPGRKTATSQPTSEKKGDCTSVGAKKHDESPTSIDQGQVTEASQAKTKEENK